MANMKHLPNPRKRPIKRVTPEFPPLPAMLSEATVDFAGKSQEALRSVPTISTNLTSVFLPLISPNRLHFQLWVEENSVFVVLRKSYFDLKLKIDSFRPEDYCGVYLRGPPGIGKSYLLYLLAAEYRKSRERCRVTYISDCGMWRSDPYNYLLEELATSFYDDTIEAKSILEWCRAVRGSEREEEMRRMMDALIHYTHKKNLLWLVIFDHHNALFDPSVVKKFPFNFIEFLADYCGSTIKIIVAASADNSEDYPAKMRG